LNHSIANLAYLSSALLLLFLYFRHRKERRRIKRWQKSLHLRQHAKVFQEIYHNENGFVLSRHARQQQDAFEYVYGEIEFLSFIALLSLTKPGHETVFYDLGCGIGKAVLACAMVYPVHKSVGVELFPELYFSACKQAKKLVAIKNYAQQATKIEFILGNFLEVNLNDATLIFINSSAILGPTWEKLCTRLEKLPQLKTVITTSKALLSHKFSVVMSTKVEMSWGVVLAYIHKPKN